MKKDDLLSIKSTDRPGRNHLLLDGDLREIHRFVKHADLQKSVLFCKSAYVFDLHIL